MVFPKRIKGSGSFSDYGNRLRSDSINAETFRYDGLGHRQRADSTSLGEILWLTGRDGKPVWMANRREGGIAHTYLYLGNQLVATQIYDAASNPVLYQTTDTLGSVIAQTNQEAWVDHFNYYQAWGGLQSGSLDDGPGYANQINDTNTGLSYAQQRYYDPSVSRFMSMDPVDANTVTGGNFNRYVYANDNPYRFTDPDGRQECTAGREQTNEHCGPPPTTTGCLTTGCSGSANVSVTIVDNSYRRGGSSAGATSGAQGSQGTGNSAGNSSGSASQQSSGGSSRAGKAPSGWVDGLYFCQPNCTQPGPALDAESNRISNSYALLFFGPPILGATAGTGETVLPALGSAAVRYGRPAALAGCLTLSVACGKEKPFEFAEQKELLEEMYEGEKAEAVNIYKQVFESDQH